MGQNTKGVWKVNGEILWVAFCITCGRELKANIKGNVVESIAKLHAKKSGHSVIVGNRWN